MIKIVSDFLVIIFISLVCLQLTTVSAEQSPTLYQVSSIHLVESGNFSGIVTVHDLKEHGTLGAGSLENLDGELSVLDGNVWQIRSDGVIVQPSDDTEVCYGNTIPFDPQITFQLNKTLGNDEFFKTISDSFPDQNSIYAFRIDGEFDIMNVRSVPAQEQPYPPLSEVVKHQTVFPLENVSGTMSGFWFPEWMQGVNYPGFHSHFITDNRDEGGHVLNLTAGNVSVSIQPVYQITMILPGEEKLLDRDIS